MNVSLKVGIAGNMVVYTGKAQPVEDAFTSIIPYLDPNEVVYYYNNVGGYYESVLWFIEGAWRFYGTMVPYGVYWIAVTQDCIWTYGADATPPSSVQLYSGRTNLVAYSGPSQSVEAAFASIWSYLMYYYYYDPHQGWLTPDTMILNTAYGVRVDRDCVWSFVGAIEFEPGSSHVAKVTMTNPTAKAFDYSATLYMGIDQVAMDSQSFHLEAGESKEISFTVAMPGEQETYPVYLNVFSAGELLEHRRVGVDVTIISGIPTEGMITLYGINFPVRGTDWNWCAYWYYADGTYGPNMDDYYGRRGPNEACTPAKPIPLNNLSFNIQEGSWEFGYTAKGFGPFVVKAGKTYVINWQTGELSERA